MAQDIKTFSVPVWERETALCRGEGAFAVVYSRLSESSLQVHCSIGLHIAAKHYAVVWGASLLRSRGSTAALLCASLLRFFYAIV